MVKATTKGIQGKKKQVDLKGNYIGEGYCIPDHSDFKVKESAKKLKERLKSGFSAVNPDKSITWWDDSPYNIELTFRKSKSKSGKIA